MAFDNIVVPQDGKKITVKGDKLEVPDNPILAYIEGDGIGLTSPPPANDLGCGSAGCLWRPAQNRLDGDLFR
jgi:hypothetical protein